MKIIGVLIMCQLGILTIATSDCELYDLFTLSLPHVIRQYMSN
jgi:hypothetical protein